MVKRRRNPDEPDLPPPPEYFIEEAKKTAQEFLHTGKVVKGYCDVCKQVKDSNFMSAEFKVHCFDCALKYGYAQLPPKSKPMGREKIYRHSYWHPSTGISYREHERREREFTRQEEKRRSKLKNSEPEEEITDEIHKNSEGIGFLKIVAGGAIATVTGLAIWELFLKKRIKKSKVGMKGFAYKPRSSIFGMLGVDDSPVYRPVRYQRLSGTKE